MDVTRVEAVCILLCCSLVVSNVVLAARMRLLAIREQVAVHFLFFVSNYDLGNPSWIWVLWHHMPLWRLQGLMRWDGWDTVAKLAVKQDLHGTGTDVW